MLEAWEDEEKRESERIRSGRHALDPRNDEEFGYGHRQQARDDATSYNGNWDMRARASSTGSHYDNERAVGKGSTQFDLDIVEGSGLTRGNGRVTCACSASDCVVLGTSSGAVVRYDYSEDMAEAGTAVHLSKGLPVRRLFLDKSGRHAIASVGNGSESNLDYAYVNPSSQKPRHLPKLKGQKVGAIGWTDMTMVDAAMQSSATFTGPMIIGNDIGQFHEFSIDLKDKKDKSPRLLHQLEQPEAIHGIEFTQIEMVGSDSPKVLVLAITTTRCYFFCGGPTLETIFTALDSNSSGALSFIELPGQSTSGELHLYRNLKHVPQYVSWAAAPGIFHGHLKVNEIDVDDPGIHQTFLRDCTLLDYPSGASEGADEEKERPISTALTEYHFVFLYSHCLKVVNRLNEAIVYEQDVGSNQFKGQPIGLSTDESTNIVYLYTTEALYSFGIRNEEQDVWKIYLEKGQYDRALDFAYTVDQRNKIYKSKAENAMRSGDYSAAAVTYASVCGEPSFEEICLRFIELNQLKGLSIFLREKLSKMTMAERTQATMVSTWMTEIHLDAINEAYTKSGKASEDYREAVSRFREFLGKFSKFLDESTTVWLLSSYGHIDELIHYASMIEDYETVMQHLIQQSRGEEALRVLRKPGMSCDLWYRFSPELFALEPGATVDAWIIAGKLLDPIKLLPSLLTSSEQETFSRHSEEATKYLEFCVRKGRSKDCRVHNLLLSFLCQRGEEGPLLNHLTGGGLSLNGEPYYDAKFALRLCTKSKMVRCCVQLYSMMGLYEEAVNTALHVDLELAKSIADRPEDDDILRKKLWLVIAKHVIDLDKSDKGENIRKAIAFRKETDSLVKIEDILPFFPNFVLIDDFKEAIIQSLEEYNSQIEELRGDMDEITLGTEALRKDIASVSNRVISVVPSEPCAACNDVVTELTRTQTGTAIGPNIDSYYIFPCKHIFHTRCLVKAVWELSGDSTRKVIESLCDDIDIIRGSFPQRKGTAMSGELGKAGEGRSKDESCKELDAIISQECPYCGDLMVKSIGQPFLPEQGDAQNGEEEVDSWAID